MYTFFKRFPTRKRFLFVESLLDAFTQKNGIANIVYIGVLIPKRISLLGVCQQEGQSDQVWGYGRGRRSCDEGGMTDTGEHILQVSDEHFVSFPVG